MTKLHPACRDNFVVFAFHRTIVTLFLPYLAAFRNNFHPGNRASPVVSVYMKNFHPGKRDLASFKRDLANRASPLVAYKRTVTVIRKTLARRDLAYRAVSPSGPARLPYKQPLKETTNYHELMLISLSTNILPTTVGSKSTKTALGTCFPAPVSLKKVLKESSPPPMVLSLGI